jgi:3-carboxy-cis,cis-muconate cycloisomerase
MADLFWPGDERADLAFDQGNFLETMAEVEVSWLMALRQSGIAPGTSDHSSLDLVTARDLDRVAEAAEASGNAVVPLVALMRERLTHLGETDAATWLHRGLTSQDVLDTAAVLCARTTAQGVLERLDQSTAALALLAAHHRHDLMAGRTLTQHAVPITFGLKAAQWLQGLLDARDDLRALRFPIQVGGAAGTLSALAEITGDADAARFVVADCARILHLDVSVPWHTNRATFTRYADALVRATDAMGHVANDVLLLARPEIAELHEPGAHGRGGSSTMPHKQNPVLSVLVRRAALTAPGLGAQLHLASAGAVDERPDGAWHTEWSTLATLSRRALVASSQTAELVEGLRVDTSRMAANVKQHTDSLLAERDSLSQLTAGRAASASERSVETSGASDQSRPREASSYLGATQQFIDEILERVEQQS